MEFTIEFYVSRSGVVPVQEFLDELKESDPVDHATVLRGLAKLRNRRYHREPLSKALGQIKRADHLVLYETAPHHPRSRYPQQRPGYPGLRLRQSAGTNARLAGAT